jgi:hypothetical protein
MNRVWALTRRWLRNQYWKLYSLPLWALLMKYCDLLTKRSNQVDANQYDYLFLSSRPSRNLFVDRRIWNRAASRLPEGYTIPDRKSLDVLLPMTGDYYADLFSNSKPLFGVYVDGHVWKKVKEKLPKPYVIPDPASDQILRPMSAEYYNKLFDKPASAPGMIVDGKVWERIIDRLPPGFRLPDPATIDVLIKKTERRGTEE